MKFSEYFRQWMVAYKKDVVRDVTYRKYVMAYNHLLDICPELEAENLNKVEYQALLNKYAETHEKKKLKESDGSLREQGRGRRLSIEGSSSCGSGMAEPESSGSKP